MESEVKQKRSEISGEVAAMVHGDAMYRAWKCRIVGCL
jgi:hypothetical protein